MNKTLLILLMSVPSLPIWATTYSSTPLGAEDAERWGMQIVVSREEGMGYLIAVNPTIFSRCQVSNVSIYTRDGDWNLIRSHSPKRFGNGYYFRIEESLMTTSSVEAQCKASRATRPGDRYTINLHAYVPDD